MIVRAEQSSISNLDSCVLECKLSAFHFTPFTFGIVLNIRSIYFIYALAVTFLRL